MDKHLFLKGQRVITKHEQEGEVVDAVGDTITVKLDNGDEIEFPSAELVDNNSAG